MTRLIGPEESREVRAQVLEFLQNKGAQYEIRSSESIYVPKPLVDELMLELSGQGVLSDKGIYKFVDDVQITTTKQQFDMQSLIALQRKMQMKLKNMTFVKNAMIEITPASERSTLGFVGEGAKASVLLELKSGKTLNKDHIQGIANMISGAVPNLKPSEVKIVDTSGKLYRIASEEVGSGVASTVRELEEELEATTEGKVRRILEPIYREVYASARIKLSQKTINERRKEYTAGEIISSEKISEKDQSTFQGSPAGVTKEIKELSSAPSSSPKNDIDKKEQRSEQVPSELEQTTYIPPGSVEAMSIAVVIPTEEVKGDEKTDVIKQLVKNAIGPDAKDDGITVSFMPIPSPKQLPAISATTSVFEMVEKYTPSIFMGLLSLIVIFMLYRVINTAIARTRVLDSDKVQEILQKELEQVSKLPSEPEIEKIKEDIASVVHKAPKVSASILKQWIFEG